jgi:hypothetical protein
MLRASARPVTHTHGSSFQYFCRIARPWCNFVKMS